MKLSDQIWEGILTGSTAAEANHLAKQCLQSPDGLEAAAEACRELEGDRRAFAFAVLKKVAEVRPELVEPHREVLLDLGRPDDHWATSLVAAQAAAHVSWPKEWHERLISAYLPYLDGNKFVKSWALRALWPIAEPGSNLHEKLLAACNRFLAEGGAPAASARNVLKQIK